MFTPHTPSEKEEMLKAVGVKRIEDLFCDFPTNCRFPKLNLPKPMTEMEIMSELQGLSMGNLTARDMTCFLGAGAYNHFIPAIVDSILRRGEFYTAYTPYQPEISQGTLQAIFEYQSLVATLTGMDASNASHYDGATATAEAAIMALSVFNNKRNKIVLSKAVHPHYRATLRTYLEGDDLVIVGDEPDARETDGPHSLVKHLDDKTALVIVQYPDFFGRIFDLTKLAEAVHKAGALLAVVINPISLGLLKTPGEFGADIVLGEGQPLGIPLSFGGPYLGIFTAKKEYVRKISGRLVGESIDTRGQRAYVLTLTAREQHIRREKATSNICTNEGLMALAACVYLSALGKNGLRQVAELCYQKAHYAAAEIAKVKGYSLWSNDPFFHEFVVKCPMPVSQLNESLLDHDILGGFDLGQVYPGMENHMLVAVTEMISREEIDYFCHVLSEVSND